MLTALLGKKVGVTQVYDEAGVIQQVTVVQAGPCSVLQLKTAGNDGYSAVQMGYGIVKPARATQPQIGHAAKSGGKPCSFVREVRLQADPEGVALGEQLTVGMFDGIYAVDIIGTSKGKGFAGGMKRHHFAGQCASHGTERKHRSPGAISGHGTNRGFGGDIKRGKRMAGHMGAVQVTSRNHKLVKIDKENNLLLVKGSVPGANGGYVFIRASKLMAPKPQPVAAKVKCKVVKK